MGNIRSAATVQEVTVKAAGKKAKWWKVWDPLIKMTDKVRSDILHWVKRWTAGRRLVQEKKLWIRGSRSPFPEQVLRWACQTLSASLPCFTTALLSAEGYELLGHYTFQYSTLADLLRHFNGLPRHGRDPEACFPTADCYAEAICLDFKPTGNIWSVLLC